MALLPNDGLPTTRWETRSAEEVRSGVPFAEGDVLLAKITPCLENGKLGIASGIPGGWGMTSTEVYPLRAERVITEFLASFLTLPSVRHGLASKMQGATGRQRLPKEALDAFPIPVPPLPEQRGIAGVWGGLPHELNLRRSQAAGLGDEVVEGALQLQGFGGAGTGGIQCYGCNLRVEERFGFERYLFSGRLSSGGKKPSPFALGK